MLRKQDAAKHRIHVFSVFFYCLLAATDVGKAPRLRAGTNQPYQYKVSQSLFKPYNKPGRKPGGFKPGVSRDAAISKKPKAA